MSLKLAQLYKGKLNEEHIKTWYNPDYIFWNGSMGNSMVQIPDNHKHICSFVSVDRKDNIIGYIAYTVDWFSQSADLIGIISYKKHNLQFVEDVYHVICDLFEVYHMNRISWFCFADNPAVRGYRNFIKKHGGRECGYHRQIIRMQDGFWHDIIDFEILAEEFHR